MAWARESPILGKADTYKAREERRLGLPGSHSPMDTVRGSRCFADKWRGFALCQGALPCSQGQPESTRVDGE